MIKLTTPETDALECAFALLKCSPIGNPENSSEYGRAAYRLSKHCQGSEDVSEAAMRIFAERIAEQAERLRKERDEARNKMADALQEVDLRTLDYERMKQERDEARRALRKFLKEVLLVIDSQDWKAFMESRETARKLLEGWQ